MDATDATETRAAQTPMVEEREGMDDLSASKRRRRALGVTRDLVDGAVMNREDKAGAAERGVKDIVDVTSTPESVLGSGLALKTPPTADASAKVQPLHPLPEISTNPIGDLTAMVLGEREPGANTSSASGESLRTPSLQQSGSTFESPVPTLRTDFGPDSAATPRFPGNALDTALDTATPFAREPPSVARQRKTYSYHLQQQLEEADSCEAGGGGGRLDLGNGVFILRTSSLDDTKVLAATKSNNALLRSESIVIPELFMHMSHFDFIRRCGFSQTSEVWLVKHKYNGKFFAVKQRHFSSKSERNVCAREMQSVADLPPHPNIVFYYRAWQEDSNVFTQMEYCGGGNLRQKLEAQQGGGLGLTEVLRLMAEVGRGLSFLEGHSVLHLDIKPENIYLDEAGVYHIGDFGLAVSTEGADWDDGDGRYLAPELLNDATVPTTEADVYSFGCVLFEACTGLSAKGRDREAVRRAMVEDREFPPELAHLVGRMLSEDPRERPNAADVVASL